MSGPLTKEERWRFDVQGFLVRRGALTDHELHALNTAVDRLNLPTPDHTIAKQRFNNHLQCDAAFVRLLDHHAIFDVVRELCGDGVRLDHAYGIVMSPGTAGLGLHGGNVPFDPAQFYVTDSTGIHTGLIAVQWALVDHLRGSGGFACVPGSHKTAFGLPASIQMNDSAVIEVELKAGDVVLFTEALTHGTHPWTAPYQRRTLLNKYSPGSSSWGKDERCPPGLETRLTERQKLLFEPPYVAYRKPVV